VTIGSILSNVNPKCIVWGSGIIDKKAKIKNATYLAVRGPQTRQFLLNSGFEVPEVYGDPALLLPRYFNPKVEKKYKYGLVPHYNDYKIVQEWFTDDTEVHLIDMMTNDIESKTIEFLQCERIISSSLHGIIVAHAYGIPAVWQKFSNKVFGDDVKYHDYMEAVQMDVYLSEIKTTVFSEGELEELFKKHPTLPSQAVIENLRDDLMDVCPFK